MNPKLFTKPLNICLLALFCCLLWGSATPAIKIGYRLFGIASSDTMSIILFAGIRFTLAGILTVVFGSLLSHGPLVPKKSSWGMVVILALFQTIIQYVFFYIGLANTAGAKGAIISGMSCFFAILISALLFRMEKITLLKLLGCVLGFAGIIVLNLTDSFEFSFTLKGDGALILSTVSYALSSVCMKRFSDRENPVCLSGWQFILGGLVMVAIALASGGKLSPERGSAWILMLYLGLLSAAAYTIWGLLLKYNPVSRITAFSFAVPVFGVILSIIFLDETISPVQYITALVLVCTGITLVNQTKGIAKGDTNK